MALTRSRILVPGRSSFLPPSPLRGLLLLTAVESLPIKGMRPDDKIRFLAIILHSLLPLSKHPRLLGLRHFFTQVPFFDAFLVLLFSAPHGASALQVLQCSTRLNPSSKTGTASKLLLRRFET